LAASAVAVLVFGWSWWTGVAALLTALVIPVLRKVLLRPAPGRLSGWRLPLRSRRRRKAERFIAHGYANSALGEYEVLLDRAGRASNARLLRDAAYAAAEAEQHQRCLDLARRGLAARWTSRRTRGQLHALVAIAAIQLRQRDTARAAARESLQLLRISSPDIPGKKKAEWLVRFPPVSQMMIMFAEWTGNPDAATSTGFVTSQVAARRFRWLLASQLLAQTARVYLRSGRPADAIVCFDGAHQMLDDRFFGPNSDYDDLPEYGAWRPFIYQLVQVVSGRAEAEVASGAVTSSERNRDDLAQSADYLEALERPLDLARLYQVCAQYESSAGRMEKALEYFLRALDLIDQNRYDIRDPTIRLAWLKENLAAHRGALAIAHATGDHATVCELLETARLQALPAIPDAVSLATSLEIPLRRPPRITIGGRARLFDLTGLPPGTETVDLRTITAKTGGERALHLSYWTNEDGCYWSLLGPDTVHSGRFNLHDPTIEATLAALTTALPNALSDESVEDRTTRVRSGPYYRDRDAEQCLARRLRALLPDPLIVRLRTASEDRRIPLIISPAPELARIPWPLFEVNQVAGPDGERSVRLIEVADIRLGLTSMLTSQLLGRPRPDYVNRVDAIVDPSAEAEPGPDDLPGAHRLTRGLPETVAVHGGRWRQDGTPVTLGRLGEILAAAEPGAALVFVGHGIAARPGHSTAEAALALAPAIPTGSPDRLAAAALLQAPGSNTIPRFPSRVVLAACNTASADQAEAGDWLSLVPAVHWAGAFEIVSSMVPVPDGDLRLERSLTRWLGDATHPDTPLSYMLLSLQRDALNRWRAGEAIPPIGWAFYLHSGLQPPHEEPDQGDRPDTEADMVWTQQAVYLFYEAAKFCVTFRRRVMHTSTVAGMYVAEEASDAESLAGAFIVYPIVAWELVNPLHNPLPSLRKRSPRPSRALRRLVSESEAQARAHGRRHVIEADVLLALAANRRMSGSWLLRRVSRIRHRAVRTRLMTDTVATRGLPTATFLDHVPPHEADLLARLGFDAEWFRRNAAKGMSTVDRFGESVTYVPVNRLRVRKVTNNAHQE
jgi:tetratricopeptide (TPR) repeat protein